MSSSLPSQLPHDAEWSQRLEEWRDGLAKGLDSVAIESHVASCEQCRDYLAALDRIDVALSSTVVVPSLSADFDLGIWSRIDSGREIERALAKQRAQEELRQQLTALNAAWRRRLIWMIPGVSAGMALAFWLASLVSGADVMASFASILQQQLGPSTGQLVQTIVTGLLGGAAGFAMSQWAVPSTE
jgi:hypothetical protein